ncbi:MAG: RsmB/NOP family class I SAM-dependent RNA methyltransferase [Desulfurococcaceae archaeon]|jgi:16S rRNA (cytosine967-C5)-methyltransferase|nr:RsmB/NOP family class I SAM-dependent RNA methyltransferase [Desulfurococcaceae archaeon]
MNVDIIAMVLANTLYVVEKKRISTRKAFSYVCKRYGCGKALLDREFLFKLALRFISSYYTLLYIAERGNKVKRYSHRLLARLFLYTWFLEEGKKVDSKLRKSIKRDVPDVDKILGSIEEPWARLSYPKWLFDKLVKVMPIDEAIAMLNAMNKRVVWIRINTLKIDIDRALHKLEEDGVTYEVERTIPFLVKVVKSRAPIRRLELFKNGSIVVQDKASVLTVMALKPEPGMIIYDFAAAPGIKTSLIMQLTENRARVIAVDLSKRRLEAMKILMQRYGVDVDRIDFVLGDSRLLSLHRHADASLVDAPCSSSGAISKDPAIKIILRNSRIPQKMSDIQKDLLLNALRYSEKVTYATCSILPDEGEEVVEHVLTLGTKHKLTDPAIPASRGYQCYSIWSKVRRTFPHIDNSEGFFIANLEK